MSWQKFWSTPIVRNVLGILLLLLAWYLPDRVSLPKRDGFQKILPYLMLLTMYGWIFFHNRVLLDKFYFSNKRPKYFAITGILMVIISINIYLTIHFLFNGHDALPQILGFWVFTIAGSGVYLLFHYRDKMMARQPVTYSNDHPTHFDFSSDGRHHSVPVDTITYIESLENYIKVFIGTKAFLVRMSLKEAEQMLSPIFIRISRSHLVNARLIRSHSEDTITVSGRELKIGKVYKKYVKELIG